MADVLQALKVVGDLEPVGGDLEEEDGQLGRAADRCVVRPGSRVS